MTYNHALQVLFAELPPREPLTDLRQVVRDFRYRFDKDRQKDRRDPVIEYTRNATSWRQAVRRAVNSRGADGKMFNHQTKIPQRTKDYFGFEINQKFKWRPDYIQSFDTLHDAIEGCAVPGIGPVTIYDVSVRLGAFLGIEPTSIYLHAGVWEGWKALAEATGRRAKKVKRIPRQDWPTPLKRLSADEAEDLLCCYRSLFKEWAERKQA